MNGSQTIASKREARARDLALSNDGKRWEDLRPVERDVYRKQAEREGWTDAVDPTCAADVVERQMRGRLDDLGIIVPVAEGDWSELEPGEAERAELDPDGDMQEQAEERLYAYPLSVETTTTFEIVLGTGGPHDAILIETRGDYGCPHCPHCGGNNLEITRVLYRYSWSGTAEIELTGEDREVAERFARQVVPELVE